MAGATHPPLASALLPGKTVLVVTAFSAKDRAAGATIVLVLEDIELGAALAALGGVVQLLQVRLLLADLAVKRP